MADSEKGAKPCEKPDPNQVAAHELLSELRTRITTQPLPYQDGVEARALESLFEVFSQAREAMKRNPGCEEFAREVTHMLNMDLRPITAKWHRAFEEGRLKSRDGGDAFRGDLAKVQSKLRAFARRLHLMAYGTEAEDEYTPPPIGKYKLKSLFADLPFGIPEDWVKGSVERDAPCKWMSGIRATVTSGVTKIIEKLGYKMEPEAKLDATCMNDKEYEEVRSRRNKTLAGTKVSLDDTELRNAVGLALSGGGIRSATFSLGVVQVLADRGLLEDVDFLSTVSGGGYTGSFITSTLGSDESQEKPDKSHEKLGGARGPDTEAVRHLRHYARYLMADNLADQWLMVTQSLSGMVFNWFAPLSAIMWFALLVYGGSHLFADPNDFWRIGALICGVVVACGILNYGEVLRKDNGVKSGICLAFFLATLLFFGCCWLTHLGYQFILDAVFHNTLGVWKPVLFAFAASLVVAAPTILRFVSVVRNPVIRMVILKGLLLAAGLVVPLLGLLLFYVFFFTAGLGAMTFGGRDFTLGSVILGGIAAILLLVSVRSNINLTSPHRLYRDRLARTFISQSKDHSVLKLSDINSSKKAPYHLINCALNLPASQSASMRDRKSDFFLFSKHCTGSVMTGYFKTTDWKSNHSEVDLATAMAISGAAASSHMGLGSVSSLTALMTVLNVRMGVWIHRPDAKGILKLLSLDSPGFTCLLREMTGVQMSENATWLNLSDGGHIENLGVYELLRRRCKFIICVDGEADPSFTFHGLMTLVRHAQLDFGIEIKPRLSDIRPDATTGLSRAHGTFCLVRYPAVGNYPEGIGLLLYMKLSVTGNESELIQRYRTLHPEFPHQATLDQFFDQEQFEAYRQLGVHVANGFFLPAMTGGETKPATVGRWFRRLAQNLLEPENIM